MIYPEPIPKNLRSLITSEVTGQYHSQKFALQQKLKVSLGELYDRFLKSHTGGRLKWDGYHAEKFRIEDDLRKQLRDLYDQYQKDLRDIKKGRLPFFIYQRQKEMRESGKHLSGPVQSNPETSAYIQKHSEPENPSS